MANGTNLQQAPIDALLRGLQGGIKYGTPQGQPPIDLGQLSILANRGQVAQPQPQAPIGKPPPDNSERNQKIWELVKRLGIPVGAAIAGAANKNFLPGAAGLSRGYTNQREKLRQEAADIDKEAAQATAKAAETKEFILVDPDTGEEVKRITVPKSANIQQQKKDTMVLPDFLYPDKEKSKLESEMVTIEYNDGTTEEMTRAEAIRQGHEKQ